METTIFTNRGLNLAISLISTLSLVWIFLRALLFPVRYADFIFNVGIVVLAVEFFAIVFAILIVQIKKVFQQNIIQKDKFKQIGNALLVIFLLLGWLVIWTIFVSKTYYLLLILILSLVMKIFGHISGVKEINQKQEIALPALLMMATFFFIAFTGLIWEIVFPFGPEVWALKPANLEISGSIQGIFMGMIFYYSILEYINLSEIMGWHKNAWFNKIQVKEVK